MRIKIITAAYNCMTYLPRCIASIQAQEIEGFEGYDVCIVDDASENRQRHYLQGLDLPDNWQILFNDEHKGAMFNQVAAIKHLGGNPEDVIVFLDGDDQFAHERALVALARKYADPNIWVVYGNMKCDPPSPTTSLPRAYPAEAWEHSRSVRGYTWQSRDIRYNHLRSFRRICFEHMNERDWKKPDGQWFSVCCDSAMMIPALELAGYERTLFNEEVLYIYTADHPQADWKLQPEAANWTNPYILSKLPNYEVLS